MTILEIVKDSAAIIDPLVLGILLWEQGVDRLTVKLYVGTVEKCRS